MCNEKGRGGILKKTTAGILLGCLITVCLFGFFEAEETSTTSGMVLLKDTVGALFDEEEPAIDDYMEVFPYNHDTGEQHFIVLYYRCSKNGESKAFSLEAYESATSKWYDYLEKVLRGEKISPTVLSSFEFQRRGSTITVSLAEREA